MVKHSKEARHPLVVGLNTRQIWCFECEEDVDSLAEGWAGGRKKERLMGLVADIRKLVAVKVQNKPNPNNIEVFSTFQPQSPRSPTTLPSFPSSPIHMLIEPPVEEEVIKPIIKATPSPKV